MADAPFEPSPLAPRRSPEDEARDRDLGFGSVVSRESRQRLLNRDGSFNVARYGLGFFAQSDKAGMLEAYDESCREHGHEPGMTQLPPSDSATTMFVADDVDKAWDEIGEYILHDVKMYGDWNPGDETTASISHAQTVEELRAASPAHKIYSTDEAVEVVRNGGMLMLMPLCGGIPPETAWPYVEHVANVVLPRAQE